MTPEQLKKMKNLVPRPAGLSRDGKRLTRDWMGSEGKVFRLPLPLKTNKNAKSSIVDIHGEAFTSVVGARPTMKVDDYAKSIRPSNNKLEPATTRSNLYRSKSRWDPDLESDKPLDLSNISKINETVDKRKVINDFLAGKIDKDEYEKLLKKLKESSTIISVTSGGKHTYAKNVKYSADAKKGGLYLPTQGDEPRQVIATLKGKKKINIDPDTKEPAGYIKTKAGYKHPVYETLGIGFSRTTFLLCDFDAGHSQHISIPTEKWSQIPFKLRKKIRTIEKKGDGDLQGVYDKAREYVDFGKEKNSPRWRAIVAQTKASDKGGVAGQWSAVKASIATRKYKAEGGSYTSKKPKQKGIRNWFSQNSSSLQNKRNK